ncbi:uncharacterized protein LOC129002554 isoform X2 [Macrosteles quadrilineatus]|uniref:uncharacterized protein LOC129002554 isoform X2 n=1 Tax=Macrosteles quadrilineatus TaxID=74068 RepID=UPI0023E2511F|nr:uncharacterized protein LOC129002554 isoform X2 [Macrosteles quadrilineatus]
MDLGLGLSETMKNLVANAKSIQTEMGTPFQGAGYVTEKLYMLLQLYLQNKGWNHSVEFLQCFTELKESSMLPSASYLQMMANRVTLDSQGRLVLRENGKIILPFEHFANAVMLKHMNGPHGLHLGVEGTVRAVMDSYTIGRENFGMEKEFIVEVVQNCPNPACRYYKTQLELAHNKPTYIPEPPGPVGGSTESTSSGSSAGGGGSSHSAELETPPAKPPSVRQQQAHKLADFLKANLENLDGLTSANKDLLAVHNGAWTHQEPLDSKRHHSSSEVGQEKIVRAFSEIMKNMTRMKTCVRPAMCKPYGKQSEALQKTLMDTIQLVQSLRSFLPPPHIAVSSWKNEDKHRKSVGLEELCESMTRKD